MPFALRVVGLDGSGTRTIADSAFWGLHWGADDFIYYTDQGLNKIRRIPGAGGSVETIVDAPEGSFAGWLSLSPDGDVLIYLRASLTEVGDSEVWARRLSSGEDVALESTRGTGLVKIVGSGHLAYTDRHGRLLVAPIDLDRLEFTGPPVPVARGLESEMARAGAQFAVSTEVLVYTTVEGVGSERLPVWVDRAGNMEPVDPTWTFDPGPDNRGFSLSPDGSKVVVGRSPDGSELLDIWIKQLRPLGAFSILTSDPGEESRPRWTPDGHSVIFIARRPTAFRDFNVFTHRADGMVSEADLLADEEESVAEVVLSPDNEWLVMRLGLLAGDRDIVARHLSSDSLVTAMRDPDSWQIGPALSPYGRWLAYVSEETGRREVYVRSFPDLAAFKTQISLSGGSMPVWGRTGQELFFLSLDGEMMAVDVTLDGGFQAGSPTALFTLDPALEWSAFELSTLYDVDVDDQRFLMLSRVGEEGAPRVVAAFNWLEEVERASGGGG
jgi:hypothetical protein